MITLSRMFVMLAATPVVAACSPPHPPRPPHPLVPAAMQHHGVDPVQAEGERVDDAVRPRNIAVAAPTTAKG